MGLGLATYILFVRYSGTGKAHEGENRSQLEGVERLRCRNPSRPFGRCYGVLWKERYRVCVGRSGCARIYPAARGKNTAARENIQPGVVECQPQWKAGGLQNQRGGGKCTGQG